jgi:hypothetical protein
MLQAWSIHWTKRLPRGCHHCNHHCSHREVPAKQVFGQVFLILSTQNLKIVVSNGLNTQDRKSTLRNQSRQICLLSLCYDKHRQGRIGWQAGYMVPAIAKLFAGPKHSLPIGNSRPSLITPSVLNSQDQSVREAWRRMYVALQRPVGWPCRIIVLNRGRDLGIVGSCASRGDTRRASLRARFSKGRVPAALHHTSQLPPFMAQFIGFGEASGSLWSVSREETVRLAM